MIEGVGINDADYNVTSRINGKQVLCKYYSTWKHMIKRCYNKAYIEKNLTYSDCYVCQEWLTFSNFKSWMESQDWEGKELDKDLLIQGSKVYSPSTCCFIPKALNLFLLDGGRSSFNRGVYMRKDNNKFKASISDGYGKTLSLGQFESRKEAEAAYISAKRDLAVKLFSYLGEDILGLLLKRYRLT